jgi:hypothetical protein
MLQGAEYSSNSGTYLCAIIIKTPGEHPKMTTFGKLFMIARGPLTITQKSGGQNADFAATRLW